jgi:hypothetical protein
MDQSSATQICHAWASFILLVWFESFFSENKLNFNPLQYLRSFQYCLVTETKTCVSLVQIQNTRRGQDEGASSGFKVLCWAQFCENHQRLAPGPTCRDNRRQGRGSMWVARMAPPRSPGFNLIQNPCGLLLRLADCLTALLHLQLSFGSSASPPFILCALPVPAPSAGCSNQLQSCSNGHLVRHLRQGRLRLLQGTNPELEGKYWITISFCLSFFFGTWFYIFTSLPKLLCVCVLVLLVRWWTSTYISYMAVYHISDPYHCLRWTAPERHAHKQYQWYVYKQYQPCT